MTAEKKIRETTVRVIKDDITLLAIDAFVFYASHDLQLGTGTGNAISVRGGPAIQKELKALGSAATGAAVTTSGGDLKAKYIIHAVGPRFQEPDTEAKLTATVRHALEQAEGKGVTRIAFPPMGAGFYGVPLDVSAKVTLGAIRDHLNGRTGLKEVIICAGDTREMKPFQTVLDSLA